MRLAMLSWRYVDHPQSGGAEILTHEILRRLASEGHQVTCFTAAYAGCAPLSEIDGVRLVRSGRQWTVHVHAWRWLRRRLAEFDVVIDQVNTIPFLTPLYVPGPKRWLYIMQLAREYWFRETRGLFRVLAPLGYALEPLLLSAYRATDTITISPSTRDDLVAVGLDPARIEMLPMAVDFPPLEQLEPKEPRGRIIVVGRLTPAKFIEEGLCAFAVLQAERPTATLDVVGGGDAAYRRRLERLAGELALDNVTFHGRVDAEHKRLLMRAADVHLFTSHREGWGLTVTEAAAMGTPSIGYDAPGVRDSIGEVRWLAPVGDWRGAASRVSALLADVAVYEEERRRAWGRVRTLSYDRTAAAFLAALAPAPLVEDDSDGHEREADDEQRDRLPAEGSRASKAQPVAEQRQEDQEGA